MDGTSSETVFTIVDLVDALAWPFVALVILILLGGPLRRFVENATELRVKGGGFEASGKRQIEVAASLAAAEALRGGTRSLEAATDRDVDQATRGIAETVSRVVTPDALRRSERASVLWVDDRPENNRYERRALEQAGLTVTTATTTDEAVTAAGRRRYDAVITDMGRPGDDRAGYTLLDELRQAGVKAPVIVYSGSGGRADHRAEALERGAFDSTHHPGELLQAVFGAIGAG